MNFPFTLRFSLIVCTVVLFFSCSKKEEYLSDPVSDYMIKLEPGKYITYRLDSLVFTNFNANAETHRYQVKHVVDQQITDNQGRPSWRIFTYLSDSTGTEPWTPNGTYMITPLDKQTEVIEDNLRVIRLHAPVREGYGWLGNTHLSDNPYGSVYDFSNDDNMKDWEFYYDIFESSWSYRDQDYTDVITVEQQDDADNVPILNPNNYGYINRSVEKYSKTIGMVYRKYEIWEYQPHPSGTPYKTGFGITLWMVDHN